MTSASTKKRNRKRKLSNPLKHNDKTESADMKEKTTATTKIIDKKLENDPKILENKSKNLQNKHKKVDPIPKKVGSSPYKNKTNPTDSENSPVKTNSNTTVTSSNKTPKQTKNIPKKKNIPTKRKLNKKPTNHTLEKGKVLECQISSITPQGLQVNIQKPMKATGHIDGLEISDDITILQNLSNRYSIGNNVKAKLLESYNSKNKVMKLSILKLEEEYGVYIDGANVGDEVIGRINRHVESVGGPSLMLDLRKKNSMVRCCITELIDMPWKDMPLGTYTKQLNDYGLFEHGKYVKVRILSDKPKVHDKINVYEGTLRTEEQPNNTPQMNDIIQGYVVNTNQKRSLIRITPKLHGVVWVENISDSYVKNPEKYLPQGKLITAKVIDVNASKQTKNEGKILLDMKKSTLDSTYIPKSKKIAVNQKYKGIVSRVEPYGVFVKIQNGNKSINALAHISECSEKYVNDLKKYYTIGDLVKAYVLSVEDKKVSISMKPTYFENDVDSDDSDEEHGDDASDESDDDASVEGDEEQPVQFVDDSDDDEIDLENMQEEDLSVENDDVLEIDSVHDDSTDLDKDDNSESSENLQDVPSKNGVALPTMDTDFDFEWDIPTKASNQHNDDASSSDESSDDDPNDDDDNLPKNSHKSRKNTAKKQKLEKQISMREQALADGTADLHPETISDLERLITSNPNLSQHYIKYMAYYLSCSDIDAARNIARRALNRIDFRKENEKLNIWTALLALESKYGTNITFDNTLQKACERNNPKHVYLRVCEMLQRELSQTDTISSQTKTSLEKATAVFQKMCKRFRTKKTVWISYFQFLLQNDLHEEAHAQLKQSLLSLPKYKHITTISKFAQFEYDFGSIERGRTIFNALIESNPKRIDLLFLYVDKEIKQGYVDKARDIFQKIVSDGKEGKKVFKYNDNQMKRLFKKWYTMEESCDSGEKEKYCDEVKIAAKEYVDGTM